VTPGPHHTNYLTYKSTAPPTQAITPPTPIVASLIVQYEEISRYYGYSDIEECTLYLSNCQRMKRKRNKTGTVSGPNPHTATPGKTPPLTLLGSFPAVLLPLFLACMEVH